MGRCITAIVSTAFILRWVMLRTMGMVIPYVSSNAFVGDDHSLALYLNSAWVCVVWTNGFRYFYSNGFVITMFKLWCIWDCELLCNMWWWPLNLLRSWLGHELVWNPLWFHGLPGYTGLSLFNRLLWWMIFLLNFVQLVGSVTAGIRAWFSVLLFTSVFKTKGIWKTWFSKSKVCQWSYPLCPVKDFRWRN